MYSYEEGVRSGEPFPLLFMAKIMDGQFINLILYMYQLVSLCLINK